MRLAIRMCGLRYLTAIQSVLWLVHEYFITQQSTEDRAVPRQSS